MQWLVASLILSVVLTVVVNVVIRLFPRGSERAARRIEQSMTPRDDGRHDERNVRVVVPWKAMLVVSLILTIAINVLLRL